MSKHVVTHSLWFLKQPALNNKHFKVFNWQTSKKKYISQKNKNKLKKKILCDNLPQQPDVYDT